MSLDKLSVMIPEPLPFPRAPYADALAVHTKLLAGFEDKLFAEAQAFGVEGSPFEFVHDYVGLIRPGHQGVAVNMISRIHARELIHDLHGIARALHLRPRPSHFRALIMARGVVSLHTLGVEGAKTGTPRLRLVSSDDVVEPRKQEHRVSDAYTVTRWVAHDREARHAWRLTPVRPASREEAADRLFTLYERQVREQLRAYLDDDDDHSPESTMVQVSASGSGDAVGVFDRGMGKVLTAFFPEIGSVIAETEHPGYIPLLLRVDGGCVLRWIAASASDGFEPPPSMVEAPTFPPELEDAADDDDEGEEEDAEAPAEATAPVPTKPKRESPPRDLFESILQGALEDQVDLLTTLTRSELDGEIASVGFDPEAEHALGPGIRERVIEALVLKRAAAEREP